MASTSRYSVGPLSQKIALKVLTVVSKHPLNVFALLSNNLTNTRVISDSVGAENIWDTDARTVVGWAVSLPFYAEAPKRPVFQMLPCRPLELSQWWNSAEVLGKIWSTPPRHFSVCRMLCNPWHAKIVSPTPKSNWDVLRTMVITTYFYNFSIQILGIHMKTSLLELYWEHK